MCRLSQQFKLLFTSVQLTFDNNNMNTILNDDDKKCQSYWLKAKEAFEKYNPKLLSEKEFEETIDRFTIQERLNVGKHNVPGKALACYNVKKAGKFGICQMENPTSYYRWGFCSKTCKDKEKYGKNEIYEEATFLYYEGIPPGDSISFEGKGISQA